jgi:signal transduction histidine kinase
VAPEKAQEISSLLKRLKAGEILPPLETSAFKKDGSLIEISLTLLGVRDGRGRVIGACALIRDLSERRSAQEEHKRLLTIERQARSETEASLRAKDEFLAVVSHELRSPMTAILGWIRFLRSGKLGPSDTAKAIDIIERNMKLQAGIIEDLLDMSSIVTDKTRLDLQPMDLACALQAAVESIRSQAQAKGIRFEILAGPQATVRGDEKRLQQIFVNLLSNAIKFNHSGGQVRSA